MTATDELRRLLDERGVEYTVVHGYQEYIWEFGESGIARASRIGTKGLVQMIVTGITPEQAVDTTLGSEPDDRAMVKLHDRLNAALLQLERGQDDTNERISAIAAAHELLEEAATLGPCNDSSNCTNSERTNGTCHVKLHPDLRAYPLVRFCEGVCSECGEEFPSGYNYCPNCGRRVVDE